MSILAVVLIAPFTVMGNLLIKLDVMKPGISEIWPTSRINLHTMLGTASFGLALIGYATLLQRIPLNVAKAIFPIQFVAMIVSSTTILGEPVGVVRWLGIGLISVGISVVSFTAESAV